jgi:hypothetical protein
MNHQPTLTPPCPICGRNGCLTYAHAKPTNERGTITMSLQEHHGYDQAAADIAFRLHQLAGELESGTANHIASSLAAWWGDLTHGVMELLQLAEAQRTAEFTRARERRS